MKKVYVKSNTYRKKAEEYLELKAEYEALKKECEMLKSLLRSKMLELAKQHDDSTLIALPVQDRELELLPPPLLTKVNVAKVLARASKRDLAKFIEITPKSLIEASRAVFGLDEAGLFEKGFLFKEPARYRKMVIK